MCVGDDAVENKTMRAEHHLVARPYIGTGEQSEQLVGAAAADQARRIEAIDPGDGVTQDRGAAFRVEFQTSGRLPEGLYGQFARSQRAFVCREFDRFSNAMRPCASADIGRYLKNSGIWRQAHGRVDLMHFVDRGNPRS